MTLGDLLKCDGYFQCYMRSLISSICDLMVFMTQSSKAIWCIDALEGYYYMTSNILNHTSMIILIFSQVSGISLMLTSIICCSSYAWMTDVTPVYGNSVRKQRGMSDPSSLSMSDYQCARRRKLRTRTIYLYPLLILTNDPRVSVSWQA